MECSGVRVRVYTRRLDQDQRQCMLRPVTAIVRKFNHLAPAINSILGKVNDTDVNDHWLKGTWSIFSTLTLEQRKFAEGPTAKI